MDILPDKLLLLRQGVEILEVLAECSDRKEQRAVLRLALAAFEHQTPDNIDQLCDFGAVKLLIKCLEKSSTEAIDDVTTSFCQLIELILRNS